MRIKENQEKTIFEQEIPHFYPWSGGGVADGIFLEEFIEYGPRGQ